MKITEKRNLKGGLNVDVQPGNGTRYDLVLMEDPHGGIIVVWTITGFMFRYFRAMPDFERESEIKVLSKRYDHLTQTQPDVIAIRQICDLVISKGWF